MPGFPHSELYLYLTDQSSTTVPRLSGNYIVRVLISMCVCFVGTMFWKWALSPKNPRDDFLQVAAPDPTFTDIVVPGAKSALDFAKRSSPLENCAKACIPH